MWFFVPSCCPALGNCTCNNKTSAILLFDEVHFGGSCRGNHMCNMGGNRSFLASLRLLRDARRRQCQRCVARLSLLQACRPGTGRFALHGGSNCEAPTDRASLRLLRGARRRRSQRCVARLCHKHSDQPTGGVNRSGSRAGTSRKRESKPSGSLTCVDAVEPLELLPGVLIGSGERWCP